MLKSYRVGWTAFHIPGLIPSGHVHRVALGAVSSQLILCGKCDEAAVAFLLGAEEVLGGQVYLCCFNR